MAGRIIGQELTAERLRELLKYDPETGIFTWRESTQGTKSGAVAGSNGTEGRIEICICYRKYKAHRLAWLYTHGVWPDNLIDHINGIPNDNRIRNLRESTVSENLCNQRRAHTNNKTGLLGAQFRPDRSAYRAGIVLRGKEVFLGYFSTAELAHEAYLSAKRELHTFGELAKGHTDPSPKRRNRSDTSTSGITGVTRVYRAKTGGKWVAKIKIDGVEKHLGTFPTKELAHIAYLAAKK